MLSVLIACLGCRRHCPDSCGGGQSRPVVLDEEGPVVLGGGVVSSPGELAEESLGRWAETKSPSALYNSARLRSTSASLKAAARARC
jgi:hypothetical protein